MINAYVKAVWESIGAVIAKSFYTCTTTASRRWTKRSLRSEDDFRLPREDYRPPRDDLRLPWPHNRKKINNDIDFFRSREKTIVFFNLGRCGLWFTNKAGSKIYI